MNKNIIVEFYCYTGKGIKFINKDNKFKIKDGKFSFSFEMNFVDNKHLHKTINLFIDKVKSRIKVSDKNLSKLISEFDISKKTIKTLQKHKDTCESSFVFKKTNINVKLTLVDMKKIIKKELRKELKDKVIETPEEFFKLNLSEDLTTSIMDELILKYPLHANETMKGVKWEESLDKDLTIVLEKEGFFDKEKV